MVIYPKRKKLVPSFTTKHIRSLTKGEENEDKGEKNEKNWKEAEGEDIRLGLRFILILQMWISSKQ